MSRVMNRMMGTVEWHFMQRREEIGRYVVSTVKLFDNDQFTRALMVKRHGLWEYGYETMIFEVIDGRMNMSGRYEQRYNTAAEANAGHAKIASLVRRGALP